ncbi:signal peptidase I [Candidatus Roizmanbacteria bacterium]|nr:MAG: signal peptidase I [Candidatus Roizmanbacteria bacterium]
MSKDDNSFVNALIIWPLKFVGMILQLLFFAAFVFAGWFVLQMVGVLNVQVPVSGASMLPTLPEEGYVPFQRFYYDGRVQKFIPQTIAKGDIVVFENDETHEELEKQQKDSSGFVKRVIGVAGDIVQIRDGFVYVNGKRLEEPYTLKPRSTFGGKEIQDCEVVKVPEGKLFVLGDNRKLSMDSRQIGLVSVQDVQFYIPYEKQENEFANRWRDSSHDFDTENESLFNVDDFVFLLNQKRRENDLSELKYQPKLERSAQYRAEVMLKYNEFDSDAPHSGYSMKDAMSDANYSNIVYGEFPMIGYYDAEELYDAFMEQPGASEFLLNKDYDEIGVSTFVGELNNCPVQVVVQHLAGYVPPDYSQSQISDWKDGLSRLRKIQPGWQQLKSYNDLYSQNKADIDRINEILDIRIARFSQIIQRMEANQWLTEQEKSWIKEDTNLAEEQNRLAERLNAR